MKEIRIHQVLFVTIGVYARVVLCQHYGSAKWRYICMLFTFLNHSKNSKYGNASGTKT